MTTAVAGTDVLTAVLASACDSRYGPVYDFDMVRVPADGYPLATYRALGPDIEALCGVKYRVVGTGYHADPSVAARAAVGEALERTALLPPDDAFVLPANEAFGGLRSIDLEAFSCCPGHASVVVDGFPGVMAEALELSSEETFLVPLATAYFSSGGSAAFRCSSTGSAVHQDAAKALSAAVGELIERDAFMAVWHSQTPPPALLPAPGSPLASYLHELRAPGCPEVRLADLSGVHDVPTVLATILSPSGPRYGIGCATGASWHRAAVSAANEAMAVYNSASSHLPSGLVSADDIATFSDHVAWYQGGAGRREDWAWLADGAAGRRLDEAGDDELSSEQFLANCVAALAKSDARALAVRFTHRWLKDLGLVGFHVVSPDTFSLDVEHADVCPTHRRLVSRWYVDTFGEHAANPRPHPFP